MLNEFEEKVKWFGIVSNQIDPNENPTNLHHPIVINWCITGFCNNSCIYCYGENIKNSFSYINNTNYIRDNILCLNPENVVLTGGEPLLNFNIENIIKKMNNKTNLIVDTNGIILKENSIKLFKENNVVLRISLDSSDSTINEISRPSNYNNSTKVIIKNIVRCLDAGISVIIQTVLTKYNEVDILRTAEFLYSLGIREWRIHRVITNNTEILPQNEYKTIRALKSTLPITIQMVNYSNSDPSGIILVEPTGHFYTKTIEGKKILINEDAPDKPSLLEVMTRINHKSHYNRYLAIK